MRVLVIIFSLSMLGLVLGCADSENKRYRVSGKVRFNGEPIPYGDVLITPDDAQKNAGPQGIAPIRNGEFDTSSSDGKGYGGGPAVIRVTGLTGEDGKLLCEYEFKVDLPRGNATHDIDVPASAAAKAGADVGP